MAQCGPTWEIKAWATTDDFQQEFICQPHLQVWSIFSPLRPLLSLIKALRLASASLDDLVSH